MADYLDHGRRHTALGSDPIPGIGGGDVAVASLRTLTSVTCTGDNAQHYFSLQNGINSLFATTDSSVFANASTTTFTGAPVYGISILETGLYRWEWNVTTTGGTGGVNLTTYWASSGTGTLSTFQQGRTSVNLGETFDLGYSGSHLFWTEYHSYSGVPAVGAPWAQLASGPDANLKIQVFVTRMNSSTTNAI